MILPLLLCCGGEVGLPPPVLAAPPPAVVEVPLKDDAVGNLVELKNAVALV
jgi:hypothetical protein